MRIAFLGLGKMGSALAALLVAKGHNVAVWNRTPKTMDGACTASTPVEAVQNVQAVFTMLHDDALESVLLHSGGLDALPPGAVHVSLSTISVPLARRLEKEHAARGQRYLGSPVFGRPNLAAEGKLWLAVAGEDALVQEMTPVLDVFSRGMTVVGSRPHQAHAFKLGGNFLITAMIASLSEAITFAEGEGIDAALFVEGVNSALFQSPFYASYSKVMLYPPEEPGATIALGAKDMRLFREASVAPTPLADLFQKELQTAIDSGETNEDWAAGYLKLVRKQAGADA